MTIRFKMPDQSSLRAFLIIVLCFISVGLICLSQIIGNTTVLLVLLISYLLLIVWASFNAFAFPILMFFLPWSPLLKLYNGAVSFFTIALLLCALISLIRSKMLVRGYQVMLTALLAVTTLIGKIVHGNSIGLDYIVFFAMLFLFASVMREQATRTPFYELTLFFALGIISAAFAAKQFAAFPGISQYIVIQSYHRVTRLSGFYGDPNFYSAQITACLAGVQLLLGAEKNRKRQILLIVLMIALLYCGLLSASKMFILVIACMFGVWTVSLFKRRRFGLVIGIVCAGMVVLASSAFQSLFQILSDRFAESSGVSGVTTGRTDIWMNYIYAFWENPTIMIFGQGYSAVNLNNHKASHNTLIQLVYQFGLFGAPLIIAWLIMSLRDFASCLQKNKVKARYAVLMCVGVVLPWMALDIMQFDEFFLMPAYAVIGAKYVAAICDTAELAKE